ncbi:hypothetical protein G5B39_06505 [Rhodobacteraceae bacterium SC52]|nr:hypothetical protein G5B39_06505 [Rhodobacteraceae bacterium SC52]
MTRITLISLLALGLAAPLPTLAASLSPLDAEMSLSDPFNAPAATNLAEPAQQPKDKDASEFRFVDGDVLTGAPLRDILPENQWAAPKAANANNLLIRR